MHSEMEKNAGAVFGLGKALLRGALQASETAVRWGVPALKNTFKVVNAPSKALTGAAKIVNPKHLKGTIAQKVKAAPLHGLGAAVHPLALGFAGVAGVSSAAKPNRFERIA